MNNWSIEIKDFDEEYKSRGNYHYTLTGFEKWWFERNYKLLCESISPDDKVLDLGCGDGVLADFCKSKNICGIDISEAGVNIAKSMGKYQSLYVQDISNFDIVEDDFDAVVCSLTFWYLNKEQLKSSIGCIKNVLRIGGKLNFSFKNIDKNQNTWLIEYLESEGFKIQSFIGISFRMPHFLFKISNGPFWPISYIYYILSTSSRFFPNRSYHFVVKATLN